MAAIPTYRYPQQGKLTVLGAGESGVGTAILALKKGFEVWVSDSGQIADNYKQMLRDANSTFEEGTHTESRVLDADNGVKRPGLRATAQTVQT